MPDQIVAAESDRLEAIATLNGRVSSRLCVYPRGNRDAPLLVENLNLASSRQRTAAILKLGEDYRGEAETLLAQVAAMDAAERTKGRASTSAHEVAEDTRWPEPVQGDVLLNDLAAAVRRFVVLPSQECYDAVALWIPFTHAYDAFRFSPLLLVTSPERASGKSRLLEVLSVVTRRAWLTTSPSDAVVFRKIEQCHPTFLLDEADGIVWKDRPELLAMFNAGFQRRSASVPRCIGEGTNQEVKDFSVWGPKALACIKVPLPDTTVSRSIVLHLRRKTTGERVEPLRDRTAREVFTPLRQRAVRWAEDHIKALEQAEPAAPAELSDRGADAWEPLLAIADLAGGNWPDRAWVAARLLTGTTPNDNESAGAQVLDDLRRLFEERKTDRLSTTDDILKYLNEREDRPWPEWTGGRPLSPRGLAKLLRPFGISPRLLRGPEGPFRGYLLEDFREAFARYTSDSSVTSVTPAPANNLGNDPSVTATEGVTDTLAGKSFTDNGVTDVTGKIAPETGATEEATAGLTKEARAATIAIRASMLRNSGRSEADAQRQAEAEAVAWDRFDLFGGAERDGTP